MILIPLKTQLVTYHNFKIVMTFLYMKGKVQCTMQKTKVNIHLTRSEIVMNRLKLKV
jgi:hypothetical protein